MYVQIAIALVSMVVSAYISYSMQPKQQAQKPTAFDEIDFPQAEEGTAQCVVFGDCWISDWTVLDVGEYVTESF